jgi:hypothetical protein
MTAGPTPWGDPEPILDVPLTLMTGEQVPLSVVLEEGVEESYASAIPALRALLHDERANPVLRVEACRTLVEAADPDGLAHLLAWTTDPARLPGADSPDGGPLFPHRYLSVDETFGLLAQALGFSFDESNPPAIRATQVEALRALLRLAADRFFDHWLGTALAEASVVDESVVTGLVDEVRAAVAGMVEARGAGRPVFPIQIISVLDGLARLDDAAAAETGERLAGMLGDDPPARRFLSDMLREAPGPWAKAAGERIAGEAEG